MYLRRRGKEERGSSGVKAKNTLHRQGLEMSRCNLQIDSSNKGSQWRGASGSVCVNIQKKLISSVTYLNDIKSFYSAIENIIPEISKCLVCQCNVGNFLLLLNQ